MIQAGLKHTMDGPADRKRPFIIPVFIPHMGCLHDCVFCDQGTITGSERKVPSLPQIESLIEQFLEYHNDRRSEVQIAFFGGNFLGLKQEIIHGLLRTAGEFIKQGRANSIRFSTRPDTIDPERLDMIGSFPVSTIELGAQSMDDHVLKAAGRGHTALDTENAVALLKKRNYLIGIQMMVGLPGDNREKTMITGRKVSGLSPDFARIYPTLVFEGSRLARLYQTGKYTPLNMDECISIVKDLYVHFKKNRIKVIRMGLQVSSDSNLKGKLIAGPYHPAFGHLVFSRIFLDKARGLLDQKKTFPPEIVIRVHPRSISNMRGLKNTNIKMLEKEYNLNSVKVLPNSAIDEDSVIIEEGE